MTFSDLKWGIGRDRRQSILCDVLMLPIGTSWTATLRISPVARRQRSPAQKINPSNFTPQSIVYVENMLPINLRRVFDHFAGEDTRKDEKTRQPVDFVRSPRDHAQSTRLDEDMPNLSRYWSDVLESNELGQKHVFRAKRFGRVTDLVKREWSGDRQRKFTACPYVVSSLIRVFRPPKVLRACTEVARARRRALFAPFQPHGKSAPDIAILQTISMMLMLKQRYMAHVKARSVPEPATRSLFLSGSHSEKLESTKTP
jgi:hypothetical protein